MKITEIIVTITTLILSSFAFADSAIVSGNAENGKEIAAGICAGCHNSDGNSIIPNNPILAGQYAEYTTKQLHDFKPGSKAAKRHNSIMASMVANLSDDDIKNLAAYYARQPSQPAANHSNDESLLELGRKMYLSGNLENSIPACSSCHSVNGQGIPPHYPRLKGQHAAYVLAQLRAFREGTRKNDLNSSMRSISSRMSAREMRAVSEYISTLK
ncbi:MAG: c-type cytochrome [Nitrosomonas sp.]|nr:c-type cytochrome [Nitrosomonas sp.]